MLKFTINKWEKTRLVNKSLISHLQKVCVVIHKYVKLKQDCYFDVIIVSKKEIQKINAKFRKINKPTDVLSFALWDAKQSIKTPLLGEVYLCPEYIKDICNKEHKDFAYQFVLTFVHGLLHLCGFNHDNEKSKKLMFDAQNQITYEVFNA